MRNQKPGILTCEWQDFEFEGIGGTILMTKDFFEKNYGEFEAMIFPPGHIKPYAIWSETHVVLFLNDDKLGIASILRNPGCFLFG